MRMQMKTLVLGLAAMAVWACAAEGAGDDGPGKQEAGEAASKGDVSAVDTMCRQLGLAAGCDLCEAQDWYGDGVCDSFCKRPDPDCASPASCSERFAGVDHCAGENATLLGCLPEVGTPEHQELASCCEAGEDPFCALINGVVVTGEPLPLPAGIVSDAEQGRATHFVAMVTGADRFSQEALNKTLLEGQRLDDQICSGVLVDGPVKLASSSVDDLLSLLRGGAAEWAVAMTEESIDALEVYLSAKGRERYRVFTARHDGSGVCGITTDVHYGLLWNTATDEVLSLVSYPSAEG
jgi:hypothetical protein